MGKRTIEVYVAAVRFATMLSILQSVPHLVRARRAMHIAQNDFQVALAGYKTTGDAIENDHMKEAISRIRDNGLTYDSQRDYLLFACAVLFGHVLLLIAAEVVIWRRLRGHPIAAAE